ncbi:sigma-54-dependent transcriptional regulator [Desulfotalea psychrophila]|nr:sigma-54 dependent transcriptional regulator [Desulfotalea psychrophila]
MDLAGPMVLIVDDDQVHRYMLSSMLEEWGYLSAQADDGETAVAAVKKRKYDAVLMDVRMARMDGYRAFSIIHGLEPALPVIIMTAYSSVDQAVAAIKEGAHDYLTKPLDFDRLHIALRRAFDRGQVSHSREKQGEGGQKSGLKTDIIASSESMAELLEMVSYVAPTEATVLIQGESGTGKELVAETLHFNSLRASGPFIRVNCAALAENLLESELFGHERGAFTGADRRREGRFVQADGGTLFLDEIGETSQAMQVKLLRVLQEQEFQRVGGEETLQVDVRIIAATNRNLEEEVAAGRFREDLYYRLNVVMLAVPPLRDRLGDVPLLARYFAEKFAGKNGRTLNAITPLCLEVLQVYRWPGNVRELENAIERGIIMMRGDQLTEQTLPLSLQKQKEQTQHARMRGRSLFEAEKILIEQTMQETEGNKSEASRRLGITRKTLQNKLNKYLASQ